MRKQVALSAALLLAAPVQAADPLPARLLNSGSWLSKRDAPPGVLKRGERVLTPITLAISADGVLTDCSVEPSSGHPALDTHACALFKENGHFAPGRSADGKAVPDTITLYMTWDGGPNSIDAGSSKAVGAKAGSDAGWWVTTDDLPKGLVRSDEIVESRLKLIVSTEGRITHCEIDHASARPELDRRACELVILRGHYTPARDFNGNPTQGVDWKTVRWQVPRD